MDDIGAGNNTALKHRLKFLRLSLNMTINQLSELSGVMVQNISFLENGKTLMPTTATLVKLAKGLGCKLEIHFIPEGPPRRVDYRRLSRNGRVSRSPKNKTLPEVQALVESLAHSAPTNSYRRKPSLQRIKTSVAYERHAQWGEKFPDAKPDEQP